MTYQVKLQVFEGPFDLLLHLVSKRDVDIYEVSLAAITEEYLEYIRALHELDLDIATEFLVVAATLIEIKAARLLPGPPADEEETFALSQRDLLVARLLEFKAFKEAAGKFQEALAANEAFIPRMAGAGRDYEHLCPDLLSRISIEGLAELATRALTPRVEPKVDLSHITPIRMTVAQAVAGVINMLKDRKTLSFKELTSEATSRIDVVVQFLAILELAKRDAAEIEQAETFGEITVRLRSTSVPEDFVIDEYEGPPAEMEGRLDDE